VLFLCLFAFAASGCIGTTTQHTATPIPAGEVEIGVIAGAYGATVTEQVTGETATAVVPNVEFAVRVGLTENSDFGVKITGPTVTADYNHAIINNDNFALSLDPTLTVLYFSFSGESFFWLNAMLPVLADVVKTERIKVVAGAKAGYIYVSADSDDVDGASGDGFAVGGTVGAKFNLTESFAVMPAFDLLVPTEVFGDVLIYNISLGFLF
jgi:hypothetical protein